MKLIVQNVYLLITNKGFLSSNEIKAELANNLSVFLDKSGLLRVQACQPL